MFSILLSLYVALRTIITPCPCCKNGTPGNRIIYSLHQKEKLPSVINESSGLLKKNGHYLTINDSGGEAAVYVLDSNFKMADTLFIPNTKNNDWESLAYHNEYLYIGDFGNNANKRDSLYIIKYDLLTYISEKIVFKYPDQKKFPPSHKKEMNYDCEAMIWKNHHLYLFSKNKRNSNITVYRLPDKPGSYTADIFGHFKLKEKITGASVIPGKDTVSLLTYGKIIFYNFVSSKDTLVMEPVFCKKFGRARQSEAITINDNDDIIITNEQRKVFHLKTKK